MERMKINQTPATPVRAAGKTAADHRALPAIFGLRYLEEEAAEVHDVVGCMIVPGVRPATAESLSCTDDGDMHFA